MCTCGAYGCLVHSGRARTAVVVAMLVAHACVTSSSASPSTADAPSAALSTSGNAGSLELAFAGDVHFTEHVAALLRAPKAHRLSQVRSLMQGADVSVVNFESAIATSGPKAPKIYHFKAPAAALDDLAGAGIDVVSMANNHAVDFQEAGLRQTLTAIAPHQGSAARRPIVTGIGSNLATAMAPAVVNVRGIRVAVFGATAVPDWTAAHHSATRTSPGVNSVTRSDDSLVAAVKRWRPRVDVVVVVMHWGVEYTKCPTNRDRTRAQRLVDAGALMVIGAHPHIQQGMGMMGTSLVAYSLGNFIWFLNNRTDRASTGVLHVRVTNGKVAKAWWVATRTQDSGEPAKVTDARWLDRVRSDLTTRRNCASLNVPPGWSVQ